MRQFRRFVPRVAMLFSMIAASLTIAASPASAHTLEDVVSAPAGCSWLDGAYSTLHTSPITTPSGTRYGTAYLLWSNTYQQNCAITLKTSYHGTPTWTTTTLWTQQDGGRTYEQGNFGHYTRAVRAAAGQCVRYIATISSTAGSTGGTTATGGRPEWGNCS